MTIFNYSNKHNYSCLLVFLSLLLINLGQSSSLLTTQSLISQSQQLNQSSPVPQSYTQSTIDVDLQSMVTYSPDQNTAIYRSGSHQCFTFRASMTQTQSLQIQKCINQSIYQIKYNPSSTQIYILTLFNSSYIKIYTSNITNGLLNDQITFVIGFQLEDQSIQYALMDISADNKIAYSTQHHLKIIKFTLSTIQILYQTQFNFNIIQLIWHPQQTNTLFIAGNGQNFIFNLLQKTFTLFSNLSTKTMNVMKNGEIILINPLQKPQEAFSTVYVYAYQSGTVNLISKFQNYTILKPALTSSQANIMGLVKDVNNLQIYQVTYQENQIQQFYLNQQNNKNINIHNAGYSFKSIQTIKITPSISDGTISSNGNQIYLRAYYQLFKFTRCKDGKFQQNNLCQACSTQCKTCHISSTQCTSCISNMFMLNQKCLTCSSKFTGCKDCSSARCHYCNGTANFKDFPSQDGHCQCASYAYPTNEGKQCERCDSLMEGCIKCIKSQVCLGCSQEDYELNSETNGCDKKSKNGWIIGVGIGVGVLLIVGVVILVVFKYKKKKANKQKVDDYSKFIDEQKQDKDVNKGYQSKISRNKQSIKNKESIMNKEQIKKQRVSQQIKRSSESIRSQRE